MGWFSKGYNKRIYMVVSETVDGVFLVLVKSVISRLWFMTGYSRFSPLRFGLWAGLLII